MVGRLLAGGLADLGGWRLAVGGIGLLGLACAVLTRWLLPASRHFVAAPARPRRLLATTRRLLRDPALLALYGIGATLMGAFVAVYNAMGFRLAAEPYALSLGMAGLVFCVYPLGSLSSAYAGRLADRHGRRVVVPVACAVTAVGVVVTLARPLPVVVLGLAVMTVGFFAAHGVASGWVATRAHLGVGGTGQAASLYLFAYYLGSSVFGGVAGTAWGAGGWNPVVLLSLVLVLVGLGLSLALRRMPSLLEPAARSGSAGTSPAAP
jgi:YNFM family putative membrane transporter